MSSLGARLGLALTSLVAAAAGFILMHRGAAGGPKVAATVTVDVYGCPLEGVKSIDRLQAGEQVTLIGTSGGRWAVIVDPATNGPGWVPLAMLDSTSALGDLPEVGCDAHPVTATTAATTTSPSTTLLGSTTSAAGSTTTSAISTTSTSSTTSTTISTDHTPPTVTLTADRDHLYVSTAGPPCNAETVVQVTIGIADPSLPVTLRSVTATWNSPAGPQTSGLTPGSGNRFSLQIAANGPVGGEVPVTITATAADGAGNIGSGSVTVSLRDPKSFGCTG